MTVCLNEDVIQHMEETLNKRRGAGSGDRASVVQPPL